ncbi:zf-HC2 domain-containing protein [Hyalangium rubrum]|uniref:Zf-HC2 domain-containing protein n=1 Tax=Hyalangium rubrum TaxID=3103134 RepID=A0ABU5GYK4_9BACT|nr:zf-HC2 domain-containing protein [Hyalangium sp. s54d21]MDY7225627.1 zf-HC2 domain-containing protein [Hyalangium sp. s54d21]
MSACQDYEELLTLHAAEALEPQEEARVRVHLETCAACRSEAESTARVLAQVALPPPSPAERERLEALPRRVMGAWRREQVRQSLRGRTVGVIAAAAAVLMLMVVPSLVRRDAPRSVASPSSPAALASESEVAAEFEQWASADPLTEVLDPELLLDDEGAWDEDAELDFSEDDLF